MKKLKQIFLNTGSSAAYVVLTALFTVIPDNCFLLWKMNDGWTDAVNILINRLLVCVFIFFIANVIYYCYRKNRKRVQITGNNYLIQIEYGDLLSISGGKIVINADECFTTDVGNMPACIKPNSVYGQYLNKNLGDLKNNKTRLLKEYKIRPIEGKSEYKDKSRYAPGTIIPLHQFLIMAFAKLDKKGRGYLTYTDYLDCLNTLWEQIDLYHGTDDVYLPILGSKITNLDRDLNQQELLDIMISSYILSPKRMKKPYKLHIVCRKRDGFSLDAVKGID